LRYAKSRVLGCARVIERTGVMLLIGTSLPLRKVRHESAKRVKADI
jgi:hypothetical protein